MILVDTVSACFSIKLSTFAAMHDDIEIKPEPVVQSPLASGRQLLTYSGRNSSANLWPEK